MVETTKAASKTWHALNVTIEAGAHEAVGYALMEAGALGTEVCETADELLKVIAYFDAPPDRERIRAELFEALTIYSLPSSSVREMSLSEVPDHDWIGEWKKNWQPVAVSERFIIAPPWSEILDPGDRIVIRIEPGMAFGTGTHESTRLCLKAIEKYFEGGSFLDVGTGTGILAIAAAKLHAEARVEACDTDDDAVCIARSNSILNHVTDIAFRVGGIDESVTASADCVCASLTAAAIVQLLPVLLSATCGHLILSGILDSQKDTVVARLQELGISETREINAEGEWVVIVV